MKHVMLYFGSFNPIHKGHIALAEYAIAERLCDELVLVVSPQSPYKDAEVLAPEMDRFEMAELACAGSKYPEQIKPSVVEFLLPKPSYTINTLHYLKDNFKSSMQFTVLMGSDQIALFDGWKEYEEILRDYPVYVYPRRGVTADKYLDQITVLKDAPLQDYSSTHVRESIAQGGDTHEMLDPAVAKYIHEKGLWSPEARIEELTKAIEDAVKNEGKTTLQPSEPLTALYLQRAQLHFRRNAWGEALNDFNRVLQLDCDCAEARQYMQMIQEILEFRYKDIYNP